MHMYEKNVLALFAHPDDAEFLCAGTLARLHGVGWRVHVASMTAGDLGSVDLGRAEISKVRRHEAQASVAELKGTYRCLECDDIFIMHDRETIMKVVSLIRAVKPAIVFTHAPSDYLVDHETTSKLAWTGAFSAGIPNLETPGIPCFEPVPHLYYSDPLECKDMFGNDVIPSIVVDVTSTMDVKERMLASHESQRNWLLQHHGMDQYLLSMKNQARARGTLVNVTYAEGFRQHLGHAFPRDNILKSELGEVCYDLKTR